MPIVTVISHKGTLLQGDTAFHWDCVRRSYQWNGISSLASWTYLQSDFFNPAPLTWHGAKPRTPTWRFCSCFARVPNLVFIYLVYFIPAMAMVVFPRSMWVWLAQLKMLVKFSWWGRGHYDFAFDDHLELEREGSASNLQFFPFWPGLTTFDKAITQILHDPLRCWTCLDIIVNDSNRICCRDL